MNRWEKSGPNSNHQADPFLELEDDLRALPLAEPPENLAMDVMRRVKQLPRQEQPIKAPQNRPGFRLTWLDIALSLFFSGMLGLAGLLSDTLPRPMLQYLRLETLYWLQRLELDPELLLIPLAVLGIALGLALALIGLLRSKTRSLV